MQCAGLALPWHHCGQTEERRGQLVLTGWHPRHAGEFAGANDFEVVAYLIVLPSEHDNQEACRMSTYSLQAQHYWSHLLFLQLLCAKAHSQKNAGRKRGGHCR